MKKYEYATYRRLDLQGDCMNELGEEGWKLMDVRHTGKDYTWNDTLLFMRRKK